MVEIITFSANDSFSKLKKILDRSQLDYGNVSSIVSNIIEDIRQNGDEAILNYTAKYDNVALTKETIKVSESEIIDAYNLVDKKLLDVIKKSAWRIEAFHQKQKINSWMEPSPSGEIMGQLVRPLEKVGVYVPGGKAAYPSSVLMNVIPAKVAGVSEIYMTTPAPCGIISPATIVAAKEAGVTDIYKIGGAQAIAALAFGTDTIPKVDKIVGPGNIYVALAKRSVYGYVNIDSVAGPSEILVIADENANAKYIAADLLSQAEHDELASSILITTSYDLAVNVQTELSDQTKSLERKDIINKSLQDYGAIVVVDCLNTALDLCNDIAPEHLEICINDPFSVLPYIKNAGAVFLGNYTPEPLGDYMAGPNHVLPTGGTARFFSALNIDDFIKKSSVLSFNKYAFDALADDVIIFAHAEGLTAHANAIKVRLE